jgi:predicted nucleotidyltransferase
VIAAQDVQLRRDGVELQVTYPPLAEGAYQLRLVASAITDRAGNPLGATDIISGFTIGETHTVEWIGSSYGFWDDPANWSSGVLPGPGDEVVIDVTPGGLIDHRSGATTIRSLTANGNLQLSGGTLELTADSSISGTFTLAGGTLTGAGTLTLAGTGNRWDGGAMTGSGTTQVAPAADLLITGRLGDLTLAERTIRNEGTIVVNRGTTGEVVIQPSGAALIQNLGTFEFAGKARIGDPANPTGGPRFENQSLLQVRADSALAVDLVNAGTVEVHAGATLTLAGAGTGSSSGAFHIAEGAMLSLAGRQRFESTASASGGGRIDLGSTGRLAMASGSYDLTVALSDGAGLSIEAPTTIRFLEMTGGEISGTGPLTLTLPQSELLGGTITVPLIEPPDTVRPTIIDSSVTDGAAYGLGLGRITLRFSEPMRPETLVPGNFFLLDDAGERIDVLSVSIGARFRSVTLQVPHLTTGRYRLVVAGDQIEDHRAGNRLADGDSTIAAFRAVPRLFDGTLYPTGAGTRSAVLGDLDGDGDQDIVTANYYSSASVLLGNGDGSFAARVDYALPHGANSVALGDVDGDGDLDIVTSSYSYSAYSLFRVGVARQRRRQLRGAGRLRLAGWGKFGGAGRCGRRWRPGHRHDSSLGDGDLDIVTAAPTPPPRRCCSATATAASRRGSITPCRMGQIRWRWAMSTAMATWTSSNVFLLLRLLLLRVGVARQRRRQLRGAGRLRLAGQANSVALGDVDGDGDLDIVTSSSSASYSASVLLGNGDGSFAARVDYALAWGAASVVLGDVDGDGDLDIVTSSYSASRRCCSATATAASRRGSITPCRVGQIRWRWAMSTAMATWTSSRPPSLLRVGVARQRRRQLRGAGRLRLAG